jgi:thioredoxin-related protein
MRNIFFFFAFVFTTQAVAQAPQIKWLTWEQAIYENKKVPKKIVVDVYTDWCGWCKVMDKKTFSDSAVAAYMNENFYCVKFNAEQREEIKYLGMTFKYNPEKKVHDLAVALLNSSMSYPSYVFFNSREERITAMKGYYEVAPFLENLKRIATFKE